MNVEGVGVMSALLMALFGGGSLLVVAVRQTWADRDARNEAWLAGRNEARMDAHVEIEAMRRDHEADIADLRAQLAAHHDAIIELVKLIPPDHMGEAVSILARLGSIPTDPHTDAEDRTTSNGG